MKVIINNSNNDEQTLFPKEVQCEKCLSTLLVEEEDLIVGNLGLKTFKCPCCGNTDNYDEYLGEVELDKDNIKFPINYHCFNNGIDTTDSEIDKMVKECIEHLEKDETNYYSFAGYGNTKVFVERYDGDEEYCITVCKDYYESYIPIK